MKIDKATLEHVLTTSQEFFMGCWYNMSHELSLDGDRASFVNPLNGLRELLDLYDFGENYGGAAKRVAVGVELGQILNQDVVLSLPFFMPLNHRLISLLSLRLNDGDAKNCKINHQPDLIKSLSRELLYLVDTCYLKAAFEQLKITLNEPITAENKAAVFDKIVQLTNSIIGTLISKGCSLQETNAFYRFILTRNATTTSFDDRLELLIHAALKNLEDFEIKFTLNSDALVNLVSETGDGFSFGIFAVQSLDNKRLCATCQISAQSYTIAGIKAHDLLGELVDAVSYTLGKQEVVIEKRYSAKAIAAGTTKTFTIHRPIPNPNYQFDEANFLIFCSSLQMEGESSLSSFKDNKIAAAFRLLRIGMNATSIEAKFTSYWTALESLTRDVFPTSDGDDGKVIAATLPCVAIDYVSKRLKSFILAFHHVSIISFHLDTGETLDLQDVSAVDLYTIFKDDRKSAAIVAGLGKYPFFQHKVKKFAENCQSSLKMARAIESHENKVRQQIHRVYRARNLIVHDAGKIESLEFLCANLEHYLKCCLNAMVELMASRPTVITPKECFVRYADLVLETKYELNPALKKKSQQQEKEEEKLLAQHYNQDNRLIELIKLHQ
jgi:hypothetical protein